MEQTIVNAQAKKKGFNFSLFLGVFFILIVIGLFIWSFITSVDPTLFDMTNRFDGWSMAHPLGTDQFGRDVLTRVAYSMRSVFTVGVGSVLLGLIIGMIIGSIAGIAPTFIQRLLMSVVDGLIAFPGILLAMLIVFILGDGIENTVVAIGIMMVPSYAKLSYSTVIENKQKLYVKAAKSYGLSNFQIVVSHIYPDLLPKIVTQFTSSVAGAIMIEASLSFLGLGVQPPNASLGLMLKEAQKDVLLRPEIVIPAGVSLMIVVLGFNLIGDALNDKLLNRRGES